MLVLGPGVGMENLQLGEPVEASDPLGFECLYGMLSAKGAENCGSVRTNG